ncbi:hypothetical protein DESA109040_05730 [Deinococcus saxicola]|uniref:hypothetical protein n=1 Tax=Deinococcus saxicola TaxID=249406 RepID=UPI0039EDF0CE
MSRPNLSAARAAALALDRITERTLTRLEAAGLVVVRLTDLPPAEPVTRTLSDVALRAVRGWQPPCQLTVVQSAGETLELHALRTAVPEIREAVTLSQVMGLRLDVEIDEGEGLLLRAWTVEK